MKLIYKGQKGLSTAKLLLAALAKLHNSSEVGKLLDNTITGSLKAEKLNLYAFSKLVPDYTNYLLPGSTTRLSLFNSSIKPKGVLIWPYAEGYERYKRYLNSQYNINNVPKVPYEKTFILGNTQTDSDNFVSSLRYDRKGRNPQALVISPMTKIADAFNTGNARRAHMSYVPYMDRFLPRGFTMQTTGFNGNLKQSPNVNENLRAAGLEGLAKLFNYVSSELGRSATPMEMDYFLDGLSNKTAKQILDTTHGGHYKVNSASGVGYSDLFKLLGVTGVIGTNVTDNFHL